MEISIGGLANLGPPPPPPKEETAVIALMEGVKKKEKGGFLKRLVRLGSTREVATNSNPNPNSSNGGPPPKPTKTPSTKKWEVPGGVYVPPKGPPKTKSTSSKSKSNNDKPPTYIVIGSKSKLSVDGMPDSSQTGATAALDESFTSRNGPAAGEAHEDNEDVNYVWSSVSEASSVSSTSLQEFMEWKIFGDEGGKGNKGTKPDKDSKQKKTPRDNSSRSLLLQDNPHKEISLEFPVENSCHKAPVHHELAANTSKTSLLSAPVTMPDGSIIFGSSNTATATGKDMDNDKDIQLINEPESTQPAEDSLHTRDSTTYVSAADLESIRKKEHFTCIKDLEVQVEAYPYAHQQGSNRRLHPEDDSRRSRSSRHYQDEQQQQRRSSRRLHEEEPRGSNRRIHTEEDSRASSRYYRSTNESRASGRRDYPEDDRRHHHTRRGAGDSSQQGSNRHLERPAPPMPHSGSTNRNHQHHHNKAPPSTRRSNLNWIKDASDNVSYASSPTILEAGSRKKNAPKVPPRQFHSKDRQRELQRMNDSGQQWFPQPAPATTSRSCYTDGRRPKSPNSHRDLVQIYPGVYVPLRSATETEKAIAGDFYIHTKCVGCIKDIFCILDAAYVICPQCKCVSALDEGEGRFRHGLGIGFTGKTLCEMKAKARR